MSSQELLNLIHKSVCDSFNAYQNETIKSFEAMLHAMHPCSAEQAEELKSALFSYTMETSETVCIAMTRILISSGILNISEEDG